LLLVNLPLEDNWLNRDRQYGPDDVSGHLRRYTLQQGFELFEHAGLHVMKWAQRWIHESDCEPQRRELRKDALGRRYTGGAAANIVKAATYAMARNVRPFGRRLFASNLFASLVTDSCKCGR
jgi:hypothetical protein